MSPSSMDRKNWMAFIFCLVIIVALVIFAFIELRTVNNLKSDLSQTDNQLRDANSSLTAAQTKLESQQKFVDEASTRVTTAEVNMASAQSDLTSTQNELKDAQAKIEYLEKNALILESEKTTLESEKAALQQFYDGVTSGSGYIAKDPVYSHMLNFLNTDKTDEKEYKANIYECFEFCRDLMANAGNQGIRVGYVAIQFPETSYSIVAFETTDHGLIFVDPQNDYQVDMTVGRLYHMCVKYPDDEKPVRPSYNDDIQRYTIIW